MGLRTKFVRIVSELNLKVIFEIYATSPGKLTVAGSDLTLRSYAEYHAGVSMLVLKLLMDGTASFHGLKVENVWLCGVRCHCESVVRSLLVKEGEVVNHEHTKMETLMDIMFHHGETFKKNDDGILVYSPDNRTCLEDLDVFFVRNYYKELGYNNIHQCWWLPPGRSLDGGLRAVTSDGELREMCFAAQNNDGVVDVYFEHVVSTAEVITGNEVVVWLDDTCEGDLVSKKNTSEGPKADGNTSNPTTEPNSIPNANPSPINNPIPIPPETNPATILKPIDDNITPNPMPARAHEKPNLKPNSNAKPNQKPNPSLKTKLRETTKACSTTKDKGNSKMKSKPQFLPRRITRSQAAGSYRRSANKGKGALHVDLTINDDSSDDDSSEDSSFKPIQEDSSSSEDNSSMSKPINKKVKDTKRAKYATAKTKENIMQPDDALVEDVSDGEVDLEFVGTPEIVDVYEALDLGAESDGANSWHSEEMKTPPNFEDELQSDEESDEFPIFRNDTRFSELHLQVGMKFNTKYEFREAVREYTIQEGRRIKAVCKVKECAWIVYASRDCDDSCWQIKTFNDDHTCARENTNRTANRAWVASKLVKKVRKYPNFKQCEAVVRMFVMRTIAKNKVKPVNHVGILPLKESKNWMPIWTGDEDYEKFKVHGHPTNMVVDLGKRLCTCQFWMLTGDTPQTL
ncbi:hypothetical protein Ahy_A09g046141 [Arachis hypogaea]|uniref:PB1-like domain-containing protein n=1 Tax=Arachis hypogaea TaxID=3818 RepID=A0A445BNY5_ARAHY|nr:hypothetical protein Ahy_A09g046141 [Arachis hypogaea]